MEQVKLAAAWEIADKYGVKSEDDFADLEKRLGQILTAVSSVKSESAEAQLKRVTDLITVYENIAEGNYIDNLIRMRKEQIIAQDKWI